MNSSNNIFQQNQKIAQLIQRKNLVPTDVLHSLFQQCNSQQMNLGQKLLQGSYIQTQDFAQLMKEVNQLSQGQKSTQEATNKSKLAMENVFRGKFEIIREVARGGMGIVYLARQISINRLVALKVLLTGPSADSVEVKRFFREAKVTATLNHPGVVPIYSMGQEQGYYYIAMEFIEGNTFEDFIASDEYPLEQKIDKFTLVCQALDHAHEHGILHRDIKPANILMSKDKQPYLTDFGLAMFVDSKSVLTQTGSAIGTPFYMSPEQAEGDKHKIDQRSDLYSMGIILYQILTNELPFQADNVSELFRKIQNENPLPPSEINEDIPSELEAICLKCIEKDQQSRYNDVSELIDDLDKFDRGEKVDAGNVLWKLKAHHFYSRNKIAMYVLFGIIVPSLLAGVIYYFWQDSVNKQKLLAQSQVEMICREAKENFSKGKYEKTLASLHKQQNKYPGNYKIPLLLGQLYQRMNQLSKAQKSFNRAYKNAPQELEVIFGATEYLYQSNQLEKALAFANRYLALQQDDKIYRMRGQIFVQLGKTSEGQADIAQANQIINQQLKTKLDKITQTAQHNPKTAIVELDVLLKNYPSYDEGYYLRASIHQQESNFLEAITDFSKAIDLNQKPHYLIARGNLFYKLNYYNEALKDLELGLPSLEDKNKFLTYHKLGKLAVSLFQLQQATKFYQEAIKIKPNGEAYLEIAKIAFQQQNFKFCTINLQLAQSYLNPATNQDDLESQILYYEGLLAKRKSPHQAIQFWQQALQKNSTVKSLIQKEMGLLYTKLNQPANARKYLEESLTQFPRDTEIIWALCQGYAKDQKSPQLQKYLDLCIKIEPWKTKFYYARGQMYAALDEIEKAEHNYLKCMSLNPKDMRPFLRIIEKIFATAQIHDSHKISLLFDNIDRTIVSSEAPDLFSKEISTLAKSTMQNSQISNQILSPWNDEREKQATAFLRGLRESNSTTIHQMAKTALTSMYAYKNLRDQVQQHLANENLPSAKLRLQNVLQEIFARLANSKKSFYKRLLIRTCHARDEQALLKIYEIQSESIPVLEILIKDTTENPIIRLFATRALFNLKTPESVHALQRISQSGENSSKLFVEVVQSTFTPSILVNCLKNKNPYIRSLAIRHLPKEHNNAIQPHLADSDIRVRLYAAQKLRNSKYKKAESILKRALNNPDTLMRAFAVSEYWNISNLRKVLCKRLFSTEQAGFINALDKYNPSFMIPFFQENGKPFNEKTVLRSEIYHKSQEWMVRNPKTRERFFVKRDGNKIIVYEFTSALRFKEALLRKEWNLLQTSLSDPEDLVRRLAFSRAISFGEKVSLDIVKKFIWDKDSLARFQAITTLSSRGHFTDTLPLVNDISVPLVFRMAVFLGGSDGIKRNSGSNFLPFMFKTQSSPDPKVRMLSIMTLGMVKKGKTTAILNRFAKSPDFAKRVGVALAYFKRGGDNPEIFHQSLKMMNDKNEAVRNVAAMGVAYCGMRHKIPELDTVHQEKFLASKENRKAATLGYMHFLEHEIRVKDVLQEDEKRWKWQYVYENYIKSLVTFLETRNKFVGKIKNPRTFRSTATLADFIQCFNRAIELEPQNPKYIFERGLVYYAQGDYREALKDIEKAIQLDPNSFIFSYWQVKTLLKIPDYQKARRVIDQVAQITPWNINVLNLQVEIHQELKSNELTYLQEKLQLVNNKK